MTGCSKTADTATTPASTTTSEMFWSNQAGSNISVTVDGTSSGTITTYYSSNNQTNPPACGTSGCYTNTISTGLHNYTATDGTHKWSGSFNAVSGCNTMLLYW